MVYSMTLSFNATEIYAELENGLLLLPYHLCGDYEYICCCGAQILVVTLGELWQSTCRVGLYLVDQCRPDLGS